jgi:hypothetical protein
LRSHAVRPLAAGVLVLGVTAAAVAPAAADATAALSAR